MIRLSQLTAFHINDLDTSRSLNESPKLYAYQQTENARTNTLIVQEDTSSMQQMTRNNAVNPSMSMTLMGTANFYPEQGLGLVNFHQNSELHVKLNDDVLPAIRYKNASLYFSNGALSSTNIVGHWIKVYCRLSNGTDVVVASVVDFQNDSNILAKAPKLFESQIFSEALDIQFIDVEYLMSSTNSEVIAVKQFLFGNNKPTEYFIEYSAFTQESIDSFTYNGFEFTRLSPSIINEQQLPLTLNSDGLMNRINWSDNMFSISSEIYHQKYNVEDYLNTLKEPLEVYKLEHQFTVNSYNSSNTLIETYTQTISNPTKPFDNIKWCPIVDKLADHSMVECTIRIENVQTGLVIRKDAARLITSVNIHKFKAQSTLSLNNIISENVQYVVNRQVNNLIQSSEVPRIVQIEKRIYVQSQELNTITIFDAEQFINISSGNELSGNKTLTLQIGSMSILNEDNKLTTFKIPKSLYSTSTSTYLILNSDNEIISSGKILKA